MPQLSHHYDQLIAKLDRFIRKFYVNQLIRGALYTLGTVLVLFMAVSIMESQFYFSTGTRKLLWYGFLGLSLLAFGGWVMAPLARYFRLGSVISHEQAAEIIGQHFGNVKDKLLNVLQLRQQAAAGGDTSLLLASIDQKASEISPVPFRSAIDLRQNRRYLKYALPPLMLLVILLFAAPSLIKDGTNRLIRNNEAFERPAPFSFVVEQEADLEVIQYGDFPLTVRVEGDVLPAEAFIEVDGYRYRLQKENASTFTYQFSNVQEDTPFQLAAAEVESKDFTLEVLPKPNIASFSVELDYPNYLGRPDETLANIGDLTVPAGTRLKWSFDTENTDQIDLRFASQKEVTTLRRDGSNLYSFDKRAMRNDRYTLYVGNERLPVADSVSYGLSVIPDLYPQISVESFQDSTDERLLFFVGEASDDHGLSKLNFVYRVKRGEDGAELDPVTVPVSGPAGKQTRYDYVWDLANDLPLEPGDELTYYFEVFDNDAVNGAKSARTGVMAFRAPTEEELEQQAEANDNKVKDELKKALEATRELKKDTKELRERMLQEKEMDWKMRKELEKLADRQQEVQKQIDEAQKAFEENLEQEQQDEQIQEKQEKLQEMFEESLDQEMQELMQQIQELMEELEKDEALQKMEEMELSDEETEAELDRMLELFKQLELEKEMMDAIEKLEELAQEQEELAEENEKLAEEKQQGGEEQAQEEKQEELQEKQEDLQKEFEKLQEKMEQMEEKNKELEKPMNLDMQEGAQEEVKKDMQDAQQEMQEQNNEGASQKQKDASQKMQEMAESMAGQMQSMQQEGMQEDMDAIRQLLENIVDLSFDQEETMEQFNQTTVNTPRYVELVQNQFQINNDFELVQDSLQALAKRNFQIETFITEKVTEIKGNMEQTVRELEERRTPQAANVQQRAMTGLNDLALMLSESMQNMQQQMAGMMSGSQQCENPGNGKPSGKPGEKPGEKPGSEGQQKLNDAMKGVKEGLEKGEGGTSKEFAEMAARQAALRRAMEAKQKAQQEGGQGVDPELQELIDKMNEAEEDLVNKRLTNEMMTRQQEILNKLLEHERAEREQEQEEKRKSETALQRRRDLPPSIEEYIKQRKAEIEMFKRISPELNPYFQNLVDEYFRSLRGE